jgi:hypothetical protein
MNLLRAGSSFAIRLVSMGYSIVSFLAVADGLQMSQVLQLQMKVMVEIGIEIAKANPTYLKMSVMPFGSDDVLKTVKRISVKDL